MTGGIAKTQTNAVDRRSGDNGKTRWSNLDGSLSVSNQTDPNNKQDKQSPFAPKRVPDSNDKERRQDAPRLVNTDWTEFRDRMRLSDSEPSPADERQPRRHRLPDAANLQEPGPPPWRRQRLAEGEFPEDSEQSPADGE